MPATEFTSFYSLTLLFIASQNFLDTHCLLLGLKRDIENRPIGYHLERNYDHYLRLEICTFCFVELTFYSIFKTTSS